MSYTHSTDTIGPLTVTVMQDEHPDSSPRNWDNFGTFFTEHRNYSSPDPYRKSQHYTLAHHISERLDIRAAPDRDYEGRFMQSDEYEGDASVMMEKAHAAGHLVIPVWMYDHSGVIYRAGEQNPFSCRWDSGCVGFIFATADQIRKEYNTKRITKKVRQKAFDHLCSEVDCYSQWASGDVWGFSIEDQQGDVIDSCWGYIGEPEYARNEAIRIARSSWKRARLSKLKTLIRSRVPLHIRPTILQDLSFA